MLVPKQDGRAGMASIVVDDNFSIDGLYEHLQDQLPKYSVPLFIRISEEIEKTGTFKYKKVDLAKDAAAARPEVFSSGNALDAKITELDLQARRVKLSVKAAQIDEEKSLIAKFGEGATKSGATLKGIFEKAIGKKNKKEK